MVNKRTDELIGSEPDNSGYVPPSRVSQAVKWCLASESPEAATLPKGTLVVLQHFKPVKQVGNDPLSA